MKTLDLSSVVSPTSLTPKPKEDKTATGYVPVKKSPTHQVAFSSPTHHKIKSLSPKTKKGRDEKLNYSTRDITHYIMLLQLLIQVRTYLRPLSVACLYRCWEGVLSSITSLTPPLAATPTLSCIFTLEGNVTTHKKYPVLVNPTLRKDSCWSWTDTLHLLLVMEDV